jgi:FkbH-like protein
MKLIDALRIVAKGPPDEGKAFTAFLACGFTPLHLHTFLAAQLQLLLPQRRVTVETGLYGDFTGTLDRLEKTTSQAVAVVLEWPDFDPRLGLRHQAGWRPGDLPDVLATVNARAAHLLQAVGRIPAAVPVAVCPPTLPLPPISYAPGWQASGFDLQLRECVWTAAARLARQPNVRLVNPQRLDQCSPFAERLDVRAELSSGFPYRVPHAAAVAELLARLIQPPAPKKGLITDLDDTLWRGILGEAGPEGVSWGLDNRGQAHGLYQQVLRSLAETGILLAVASKNEPGLVEEAFRRPDLLLGKEFLYPLEVGWGSKADAVKRILRQWNIGPESAVFVDDSPMELAEVRAGHPEMECLLFPRQDDQTVFELLGRLRDLFGKTAISAEDALRLASIRQAGAPPEGGAGPAASRDRFLEEAEAELTVAFTKALTDLRALELVNKTNQFNLNGNRYAEADWYARLNQPGTFLLQAAYKDKFGPLGKIAVLGGRVQGSQVLVDTWVMSCRAFGRRIEHRCLELLFDRFQAEEVWLDFQATPRNGPLQEFLRELLGCAPRAGSRLLRESFAAQCPPLFHRVTMS